jgi:hypothetical protein
MVAHPAPRDAAHGDRPAAGSAAAMLIWRLLGAYLFRRLLSGGRRRDRGYGGWAGRGGYGGRGRGGYGGWGSGGYGGRRRSGGFRFVGPFPTYSTRSRRGSRVSVSGCCLPIPLALTIAAALGARSALRR